MDKLTKCSWYIHNHNCLVILFHFSHFDVKFGLICWKKVNQSIYDGNCQLRMLEILGASRWLNQSDWSLHMCFRVHIALIISPTLRLLLDFKSVLVFWYYRNDVGFNSQFFKTFVVFPDLSIVFNTIPDWENPLFFFNTFFLLSRPCENRVVWKMTYLLACYAGLVS